MGKTNWDRYYENLKQDPKTKIELDKAGYAIDIAQQIYDLRKARGLTQAQFAKIIGISQSNIARLENADYKSYSLRTLSKASKALSSNLDIKITPLEKTQTLDVIWIPQTVDVSPSIYDLNILGKVERGTETIDKEFRTPIDKGFNSQFAT